MRHNLGLTLMLCFVSNVAIAAIPVTDTPNEGQEKKISDCMQEARVYKQQTVAPSKGVTQSVKTPNSASGSVPHIAATDISGQGATNSTGLISGMDLSALAPTAGLTTFAPESLNLDAVAQTVLALSNAVTAIGTNKAGQLIATLAIGTLSLAQGSWDQNSFTRANNGAQWNQVLMDASDTATLFNQRGLNNLIGSNATALFLTFDPAKATLVSPAAGPLF